MAKPDLGTKRSCPSCGVRFYDLQKRPIECPKCAFTFEPEALLKSRRPRIPEAPAPVVEAEDTEDEELENEDAAAEDEAEVEEEAVVPADAAPVVVAGEEADEDEAAEGGDNVGVSVTDGAPDAEEEFEDEEIEDDKDDDLLEEVEEDEDDVSGIIDADIEKEEP